MGFRTFCEPVHAEPHIPIDTDSNSDLNEPLQNAVVWSTDRGFESTDSRVKKSSIFNTDRGYKDDECSAKQSDVEVSEDSDYAWHTVTCKRKRKKCISTESSDSSSETSIQRPFKLKQTGSNSSFFLARNEYVRSEDTLQSPVSGKFCNYKPYKVNPSCEPQISTSESSSEISADNIIAKEMQSERQHSDKNDLDSNAQEECLSIDGQSEHSLEDNNHVEENVVTERGKKALQTLKTGGTLRLATKTYNHYEGSFNIEQNDWEKCWNGEKFLKSVWRDVLRNRFEKFDIDKHVLNFKDSAHIYKSSKRGLTLDGYAYCRSGDCKWFVFFVEVKDRSRAPPVDVFSSGKKNHPAGYHRTKQLRGEARARARKELKNMKVSKYQDSKLNTLEDDAYQEGNLQDVKSDAVYQNVRSEAIAEDDNHQDDVFDVILERRKERLEHKDDRFIQFVGEPLHVYLYSRKQVKTIFEHFHNWLRITIHFDATGSVVRTLLHEKKRVYLYSAVVNCDGTLLPLLECLTSCHDQGSIGMCLLHFKTFCIRELKKKWPPFGRIVVDCSYAIINAVMSAWNNLDLATYLRWSYKQVQNDYTGRDADRIVILNLCRNHFLKMASSNLKSHGIRREKKAVYLEAIAALIESKSIEEFNKLFASFAILALSKVVNSLTKEASEQLRIGSRGVTLLNPDVSNISEEIDEHSYESNEPLVASPFYRNCYDILVFVRNKLNVEEKNGSFKTENKNPLRCKEFILEVFMPRYAPITPLWTEMLTGGRGKGSSSASTNADVEDYFKIEKGSTHEITHNKLGRFIRIQKTFVACKAEKVSKKIITSSKSYRKKMVEQAVEPLSKNIGTCQSALSGKGSLERTYYEDSSKSKQSEEKWKISKTQKWKHTYFEGRKFEKVHKKGIHALKTGKKGIKETTKKIKQDADNMEDTEKNHFIDIWHSPSQSAKLAITHATRASRRKNTKKAAAKKLKELFAETKVAVCEDRPSETNQLAAATTYAIPKAPLTTLQDASFDDFSDVEIVHIAPANIEKEIQKSSYRFYARNCNMMDDLIYVKLLTSEEKDHLHQKSKGDLSRPLIIYGPNDRPFLFEDFIQLLDESSLNSATIDACLFELHELFGNQSTLIMTVTESCLIFNTLDSEPVPLIQHDLSQYGLILIPHYVPSHWSLCVVSMVDKTFSFLDPASKISKESYKYFNAFLTHLKATSVSTTTRRKKVTTTGWHLDSSQYGHTKQTDEVSCGVFVLHFAECILKGKKIGPLMPKEYRLELAKRSIARSRKLLDESMLGLYSDEVICERFPNGLFKNISYYANYSEKKSLVVCSFGLGIVPVYNEVFRNVVHGNWIQSTVIDAAFHAHMTEQLRSKYLNVSCSHAKEALFSPPNSNSVLYNIVIKGLTLIMPFNISGNHWCIIIADTSLKTFGHYDPLNLQNSSKYLDEFLKFIENRNRHSEDKIDITGWNTVAEKKYPEQKDTSNCGIYILLYGLSHMGVVNASKYFNPNEFRKHLSWTLLEEAPDMRHLCLWCGKDEFSFKKTSKLGIVGEMVQCQLCHRWVHFDCEDQFNNSSLQEIQRPEYIFNCALCKLYQLSHI